MANGHESNTALRASLAFGRQSFVARRSCATEALVRGSLVAFGKAELPSRGAFEIKLASSLVITGFMVGDHEAINLRAQQDGKPLMRLPGPCCSSVKGCHPWPVALRTQAIGIIGSES